jgi:hypothetical protein
MIQWLRCQRLSKALISLLRREATRHLAGLTLNQPLRQLSPTADLAQRQAARRAADMLPLAAGIKG